MSKRKILVTSALPYANGPIHLGHVLEAVQTDIWVRFQKMRGEHCIYVCADDAHGTAIMLSAERAANDARRRRRRWRRRWRLNGPGCELADRAECRGSVGLDRCPEGVQCSLG